MQFVEAIHGVTEAQRDFKIQHLFLDIHYHRKCTNVYYVSIPFKVLEVLEHLNALLLEAMSNRYRD